MLEIIPSEGERDPQNPKKPGLRHLAIEVADFEAACGQLESKGIQFFDTRELEGTRLAFFDDADGNILHLVYRDEPI
jgi:glyoxylase I family protein